MEILYLEKLNIKMLDAMRAAEKGQHGAAESGSQQAEQELERGTRSDYPALVRPKARAWAGRSGGVDSQLPVVRLP